MRRSTSTETGSGQAFPAPTLRVGPLAADRLGTLSDLVVLGEVGRAQQWVLDEEIEVDVNLA
ncbi:MAG: hypothetical protein ACRCY9_13400 [Phycicoccus sp.]